MPMAGRDFHTRQRGAWGPAGSLRGMSSRIQSFLRLFGVDPWITAQSLMELPRYFRDRAEIGRQASGAGEKVAFGRPYPCLSDRSASSGQASGHYFHQDLLVARRIFAANPSVHVDVGSRIDGFVAHVASFRRISVVDIRPQVRSLPNIDFVQGDLMDSLPRGLVACADSVSCLHTIEHFGLGRYGDPIRFDGHILGIENLFRIVRPGGVLYLSTPIGPDRIEFNAHRVFSVQTMSTLLKRHSVISRFSYVDDAGDLHEDVNCESGPTATNFGCRFGCGIWECRKPT